MFPESRGICFARKRLPAGRRHAETSMRRVLMGHSGKVKNGEHLRKRQVLGNDGTGPVGAGHLGGDNGLISLLEAKGYVLTPVE